MMKSGFSRRQFITHSIGGALGLLLQSSCGINNQKPNIVFVFADEWRAQATGYMGNKEVITPHLDTLASESILFKTAVSGCSVCSPYRGSLLTGQYPLTHGVFYNDKPLRESAVTIAKLFKASGYDTGYIGKWHLNGHDKKTARSVGRCSPVPKARRQGFDFWKVRECTHDYNHSYYFDENNDKHFWEGYDAIAQTREARKYITAHTSKNPFMLFLSWGPPHDPYQTAPEKYRAKFNNHHKITLRPNVPKSDADIARKKIAGYYAHIAALDDCIGELIDTIRECGIEENTIFIFTSDHGDMLHSHGKTKKQKPWDESILIPFILHYPALHDKKGKVITTPINTPDIMPTLLGLCGIDIPDTVEGKDYSKLLYDTDDTIDNAALIMCPVPFHQWNYRNGGKEYRGIRTSRYTYVRDREGPWLLYDNQLDPYQMDNLVNKADYAVLQQKLENILTEKLKSTHDKFLSGDQYMKQWDYEWDENDSPDPELIKN